MQAIIRGALVAVVLAPLFPLWCQAEPTPPEATSVLVDSPSSGEVAPAHHGPSRRDVVMASLTIFILAVFVGFEVIAKVPPTLHTPLMSGSNAISGITVVGALMAAGVSNSQTVAVLGMLAVVLAMINVVGGFLVTHRMLAMFQRKK